MGIGFGTRSWSSTTIEAFRDQLRTQLRAHASGDPFFRLESWPPTRSHGFQEDIDEDMQARVRMLAESDVLFLLADPVIHDGYQQVIPHEFLPSLRKRLLDLGLSARLDSDSASVAAALVMHIEDLLSAGEAPLRIG